MPQRHDQTKIRERIHTCFWKRDSDGAFYVGCRDMRVQEHNQRDADYYFKKNFAFCPYCGGTLEVTT